MLLRLHGVWSRRCGLCGIALLQVAWRVFQAGWRSVGASDLLSADGGADGAEVGVVRGASMAVAALPGGRRAWHGALGRVWGWCRDGRYDRITWQGGSGAAVRGEFGASRDGVCS